jgi:hypothetical protein
MNREYSWHVWLWIIFLIFSLFISGSAAAFLGFFAVGSLFLVEYPLTFICFGIPFWMGAMTGLLACIILKQVEKYMGVK